MDHQISAVKPANSYQAFLLRLWQESPDGIWRITLEDPHTKERHAFNGMEVFIRFLMEMTKTENPKVDVSARRPKEEMRDED
jgi:subtilisin-like proprotein convertase family protein